jgi:hypothetical protein
MQAVERGKFREDLYYRLNTVPIFVPPLRDRGLDIELLFRKFTTDFAEKYRIKPIQLTQDAQNILLSQRFPGNIRQLKNLADQISILEVDDRIVDANKLTHYLQMNSGQQVGNGLVRKDFEAQNKENFNERELLYKILFDMRRDVTELKKMFLEVLKNNGEMTGDILKGHETLFQGLEGETIPTNYGHSYQAPEMNPSRILPPSTPNYEQPNYQNVNVSPSDNELKIISLDDNNTANDVYDITHVAEEVSLSLEKQEKI